MPEPEIGVVGRDALVALVEHLVERRPRRPLPIVVTFGPGGSGKTELLRHLESRYRPTAPVAYVDLDRAGSGAVRAVLDVAYAWLDGYSNKQFGTLRLPRYELARAALALEPGTGDRTGLARELIGTRLRGVTQVADTLGDAAEAAPTAPPLFRLAGRLLRPFLRQLVVLAVVLPTGLRRLFGAKGGAIRWFEQVAGPELLRMPARRVDEVIVDLWKVAESTDLPSRTKVDRLLVHAFLADLKAAYRWRRHRRVNALFLLDDADLLPGAESRNAVADEAGVDILDLLAEAYQADPELPLLVVAAKQATSTRHEPSPVITRRRDPMGVARARYGAWLDAYRSSRDLDRVYLTARLTPFTPKQTRQLLSLWNDRFQKTAAPKALVEHLQEVTHGHPLALKALYRSDRLSSPRRLFAEDLRSTGSGQWGHTLGGYIRWRFLQRLEGVEPLVPEDGNGNAEDFLARLAAPLRLDASVVQLLAGLEPEEAERMLARLAEFSFAEPDPAEAPAGSRITIRPRSLTLHPLLRDLLVPVLIAQHEPDGEPSYLAVHARLRDHYKRLPDGTESYLYHCLALGDVREVAEQVRRLLGRGGQHWLPLLLTATRAPRPDREVPRWRTWLQERGRTVAGIARGERSRVEELVEALWDLHSCTSAERRTPALYGRVLAAFQALADHGEIRREDRDVDACIAEYERDRQALIEEAPVERVRRPPEYCRPYSVFPYPPVWPPRHFFRKTALVTSVALLLGYAAVYAYHDVRYCNTPSPLDAGTVFEEVRGHGLGLTVLPDGQCIGVTDRPGYFIDDPESVPPGDTGGGVPDHEEVAELLRLIHEENQEVLRTVAKAEQEAQAGGSGGGREDAGGDGLRDEYVTVVVATMLSSDEPKNQRDLSAGVNELRGAYLAQRAINSRRDSAQAVRPYVRLALANFGGNSEHAEETAERIRTLVENDPTVVAVTGMGQTRTQTIAAAEILGDAGGPGAIPMVGSVPSGNDFEGKPYFFRVGPSNDREAEALGAFVHERFGDRIPFVVTDENDLYSHDLAGGLLKYLEENGDRPVRMTYEPQVPQSFLDRADELCATAMQEERAPLVLYTGRTNELPTLLKGLKRTLCWRDGDPGNDPVVVGGDDLSQLETAAFGDLRRYEDFVDRRALYFATFAPHESHLAEINATSRWRDFFSEYEEVRDKVAGGRAFDSHPNGHVMLAYDAVSLVHEAAAEALSRRDEDEQDDGPVQRRELFETLRGTRLYAGIGGVVSFPEPDPVLSVSGSDPVDKLVIVQRVARAGKKEVEAGGPALTVRYEAHYGDLR